MHRLMQALIVRYTADHCFRVMRVLICYTRS